MTRTPLYLRAAALSGALLLLMCGETLSVRAQKRSGSTGNRIPSSQTTRRSNRSRINAQAANSRSANRSPIKVRVRAGDTISALAARFNVTADEMATLNGLSVNAQLQPGRELAVPVSSGRPSTDVASEISAQPADGESETVISNRLRLNDGTMIDVDDVWEDAQGIWYRLGGVTHLIERSRIAAIERSPRSLESQSSANRTVARIVEVNEAQSSKVVQPVWIYLAGGARVEADDVTETATGAWYRRGPLSIFLERARIERIEREAPQPAAGPVASRSWTERGWSTGNAKIDNLIRMNGARYGVDPYLIFCVMEQESRFNPRVVSPKGAAGLMQLMPGTGARFGVRRPFDPAENIMGGTRYLKQLLEAYGGRVDLVLAGYNAGEGAVAKYGGRVPPYRETREYVKRISLRYTKSKPLAVVPSAITASSRLR
jgi:soluble lytic murein transglycosylase-like protein/LysM repeat protein